MTLTCNKLQVDYPETMKKELLTPSDVAKLTGVTPATVRIWADSGRLPVQRTVSGNRLSSRPDVERLARERQATEHAKEDTMAVERAKAAR